MVTNSTCEQFFSSRYLGLVFFTLPVTNTKREGGVRAFQGFHLTAWTGIVVVVFLSIYRQIDHITALSTCRNVLKNQKGLGLFRGFLWLFWWNSPAESQLEASGSKRYFAFTGSSLRNHLGHCKHWDTGMERDTTNSPTWEGCLSVGAFHKFRLAHTLWLFVYWQTGWPQQLPILQKLQSNVLVKGVL